MDNKYIVFELTDPCEPDIPKLVAWGPSPRPWLDLWSRSSLEPNVSAWFQILRRQKLMPVVRHLVSFVNTTDAQALEKFKIQQIARWAGTAPMLPSWYLGSAFWERPANPRLSAKPVIRVKPDGKVDRWPSIYRAAISSGHTRQSIKKWIRGGIHDPLGGMWRLADL